MPTVGPNLKKKAPKLNPDKITPLPGKGKPVVSREALERAVDRTLRNSPALQQIVIDGVRQHQEQIKAALQVDKQVQEALGKIEHDIRNKAADALEAWLSGKEKAYKALSKHIDDQLKRIEAQANVTITVKRPEAPDVKLEGLVHHKLPLLIKQISIGNAIWLAGPTQSGKSKAMEQVAEAMGIPFTYHAFGPTQTETKLSGFQNAMGEYVPTELYYAVKYGWLFLGDEADNCQANVLIWANNGISNGKWSFPRSMVKQLRAEGNEAEAQELERVIEAGGLVTQHPSFRIIFSANTWGTGSFEYIGRSQLDISSLARFDKVEWPYDEGLERKVALAKFGHIGDIIDKWVDYVQLARAGAARQKNSPVVITPSHTLRGARNLAGGLEWDYVTETSLWAGIDPSMRAKIESEMQQIERSRR